VNVALRIVTVFMLVFSLGLHWALLQTVAWTGMLITYAHDASLQEAITKTIDGQHPCPLCKVVEKGRADEKRQEKQRVKSGCKLDVGLTWQPTEFCFLCIHDRIPSLDLIGHSRGDEPPKPLPRGGLDNHARA
jgi:hypothetical protein